MKNSRSAVGVALIVLVALISGAVFFSQEDEPETKTNEQGEELTNITLFLTYVPNVQFAPIYVAIENGYFADEGLNVTMEHSYSEPDGVERIALDELQFGIISGEQVVLGRSSEKPVVYVMEWYHRFPVGIVVPADSDIQEPGDLAGKKVGIPELSGASYMGLRAFLGANGMSENDLELEPIGFNAPGMMCENQVDAAVVYIANEPLQIASCYEVRVIEFSDYITLVSNGLITNEKTIAENPELVEKMVRALTRGVEYSIANPEKSFELSLKHLPDLGEERYDVEREVLRRSTELWQADVLGETTQTAWENTQAALIDGGLLSEPLADLSKAYTNQFVPKD